MHILDWRSLTDGPDSFLDRPSAVAIGVFDGLHPGHRELIERTRQENLLRVVISFRQAPAQVLRPDDFPGGIMTLQQRLDGFSKQGVDLAVIIEFDESFADTPGPFFLDTLERSLNIERLIVGWNFRCGRNGETGRDEIARRFGSRADIRTAVLHGTEPISSSRLRSLLVRGRYDQFAELSGAPHVLDLRDERQRAEESTVCVTLEKSCLQSGQLVGPPGAVSALAVGAKQTRIDLRIRERYLSWPLVENDPIDYIVLDAKREKER